MFSIPGWLHIYNPMKPEGAYELDLGRREERVIVKTLAQLATAEPGDNLPEVSFRWEREMDPMPGTCMVYTVVLLHLPCL